MKKRPIVLMATETADAEEETPAASGFVFDGKTGVWRDGDGHLAIQAADPPMTRLTATREGVDQSERAVAATRVTKTREGIDQSERSDG